MKRRALYQRIIESATEGAKTILAFLPGKKQILEATMAVQGLFLKDVPDTMPRRNFRNPKPKGDIIVNQVTVRPVNRQSLDIQKWRNALIMAEGDYDQRVLLYDLYDDVLLDGHLCDAIDKRVNAITNASLQFVDAKGKPIEAVNEILETTFFEEFLTEVMQSKFWGHSLLELDWGAPGSKKGTTSLVPRKHVKPRLGIVTQQQWGMDGISYRDRPNIIEVGKANDLGRLLQVSQYVIYKRGGFGDWAEYAETFGTPFRWATYNNEQSRTVLETALAQAGTSGYVVAPTDANLQFLNANPSGQGDMLYNRLREACNEEISVTILGNTMTTTEAKSSGYAQSYTHAESQSDLHKSDRRFVLRVLGEMLTPYLASIGYPVKGAKWTFYDEERISMEARINIDMQVASKVPIPNYYWYERYNIPAPAAGDEVGMETDDNTDDEPPAGKKD